MSAEVNSRSLPLCSATGEHAPNGKFFSLDEDGVLFHCKPCFGLAVFFWCWGNFLPLWRPFNIINLTASLGTSYQLSSWRWRGGTTGDTEEFCGNHMVLRGNGEGIIRCQKSIKGDWLPINCQWEGGGGIIRILQGPMGELGNLYFDTTKIPPAQSPHPSQMINKDSSLSNWMFRN